MTTDNSKTPAPQQPKAPQPPIGTTKPHPTNPYVTLTVTGYDRNGAVWRKLR